MNSPFITGDSDELRKRWLGRYLSVQAKADTRIRTILVEGAQDAQQRVIALENSSTFSAGVRSAQIRLAIAEIKIAVKEIFDETLPVITDSSKQAASKVIDAFTETDRAFLEAAFQETVNTTGKGVADFIEGQRHSAMLGVTHAVSRITKSERPLSARVYRSRDLANKWVSKQVTAGIIRGDSAKDLAKIVRRSIRPTVPGGVSYAAMRLGRTEINNAFHATAINVAENRPWIEGMSWHLSSTHDFSDRCLCERYANQVFKVDMVPPKPHPQCRCWVAPEVETMSVFLAHLTAGRYKDWIEHAA